jgi:Poly(R)-hydroxyalkanoic acid synthase subunit (PHA_synth_III_E)
MTKPDSGVQAVYDFWLSLIPQLFGPLGVAIANADKPPGAFDANAWLAPWFAVPGLPHVPAKQGDATVANTMFAPWASMFAPFSGGQTAAANATASVASAAAGMLGPWIGAFPTAPASAAAAASAMQDGAAAAMQPLQAAQKAWLDMATGVAGSPQTYLTGFDRTFGGLFDALGFGPLRKLQTAMQELAAASVTQDQSRASYAMLIQGAFASGLERLMTQLAGKADAGERIDSVLALLRMWAMSTEQAVHEVLQSEKGLVATAALTRAGLAHRRKLQQVASIVADALDLSTRRELDDVYRELHELRRELRAMRSSSQPAPATATKSPRRISKRTPK